MKKCYWILGLLAVALTSCSGGGDGDGGNDYINPNKGVNNTTDFAVTGGVQATGMTYADLTGYVNIPDDYQKSAATNNLVFRVGVYYGESESSLTKVEYGSRSGRTFTVTLKGLQAGKTYYYKSFLDWGNSGYGWEYWDNLGTATEVGSFTTKPAAFNGTMTTGKPSDITFFTASISASVDVSSLNAKETYIKGLIYSQNQSALSSQLAQKLSQAAKESTSGGVIEITGDGYYGGYVNGDLHFNISDNTLFDKQLYNCFKFDRCIKYQHVFCCFFFQILRFINTCHFYFPFLNRLICLNAVLCTVLRFDSPDILNHKYFSVLSCLRALGRQAASITFQSLQTAVLMRPKNLTASTNC